MEIVCHAGALMKFWIGVFAELDREKLEEGVNSMLKVALEILASKRYKSSSSSIMKDAEDDDPKA